ncbi:hypothetical protein [Yellowstone lake phycodnavirus 2]|uniref:hypothetical protein n=1 Tax=Yellowstone lake phycodnavirus 2 TaxID=1586714 RepID=UPI0006EB4E63|nr:hypothetical protein AR678_gp134 [Yellowstone lake phycodnavirus 2]BAT22408.1 hypothetical protein [Yellowstone lake phycodnavirus 2]
MSPRAEVHPQCQTAERLVAVVPTLQFGLESPPLLVYVLVFFIQNVLYSINLMVHDTEKDHSETCENAKEHETSDNFVYCHLTFRNRTPYQPATPRNDRISLADLPFRLSATILAA